VLDANLRGTWDKVMRPVGVGLGRLGLTPNSVTLLGVAVQGVVSWLILDGRLLAAGLVAILAALSDGIDGAVAKARGMTSRFGAVLDSTTDRLTDALYFLPIAWLYAVDPDIAERDEPWVGAVALVALVFSFLISYVRARAEAMGFDAKVGIAERAERLILLVAGLILDQLPIALVVLTALTVVTFFQRIVHVYRQSAHETPS